MGDVNQMLLGLSKPNRNINKLLYYRGCLLLAFLVSMYYCSKLSWSMPLVPHQVIFLGFLAVGAVVLDIFVIETKYIRLNLVLGLLFSIVLLYGPFIAGVISFFSMFLSAIFYERLAKDTTDYSRAVLDSSIIGLVIVVSSHMYLEFGGTAGQLTEGDFWPAFWAFGIIHSFLITVLASLDSYLDGKELSEFSFLEGRSWELLSYTSSFVMVKLLTDIYIQEGIFSGLLFLLVIICLSYLVRTISGISRINRQLKELLTSSEIMLKEGNLTTRISHALKAIESSMSYKLAMVYLVDTAGCNKPVAYNGPRSGLFTELHALFGKEEIVSRVINTGEAYCIRDLSHETKLKLKPEVARHLRSVMIVPIGLAQKNFGAIIIADSIVGAFGPKEKEVITLLANQLALAVENDKVYRCLEEEAITDALTGLYNQRYFRQALERTLNDSSRVSLVILDVDYFKRLNDTYGHLVGDQVLRQMGMVLKQSIREGDIAARYGGEEFVVILPDTNSEVAYQIAERIRINVMRQVLIIEGQKIKLTISGGVSEFPRLAKSPEELLRQADEALYEQAKSRDRNHVGVYGKA